ncbi:hypothetical protein SALBM311S_09244 [Streptomyces alboniger]
MSDRSSALTRAIGLRREPQPPMPRVMPLASRATASSAVIVLSLTYAPSFRKLSRTRSATPLRLASKVKPCSKR